MPYAVRRITAADALQIPELTLRVNGPSYVHAEVYHPDRLMRLNATGHQVSVVALDEQGKVVGHAALERPDLGTVGEMGEAMVLPEHRHHHLLDQMRVLLEAEAARLGLFGLCADAVTHHVFSQKTEERFHGEPTAIMLGALPASADHLENVYPQRLSFLTMFKYLKSPATSTYYLPERHRAIVSRIAANLGRSIEFRPDRRAEGAGKIEVSYAADKQRASIHVSRWGADVAARIGDTRAELCDRADGAEAIFVEMRAIDPEAAETCNELEERGFYLSGLRMRDRAEGDLLRLQWVKAALDFSLIKLETEIARELLDYIAGERARVSGAP